ncbi:phenylacetaldoxime dehydratase family protein [Pseudomonas fluorescens]|uniref:phenylacetaldoxime dehydratase family protein n=1 Tax=Pseudomonas fluorescens TaxID=294 RepID=UPI003F964E2F
MESAIPEHLRKPRIAPGGPAENYEPPFPAWSARFDPLIGQVVMAYFGVQGRDSVGLKDLEPVSDLFRADDAPAHWDTAYCIDAQGFHNCMAIAYWSDVDAFNRWRTGSGFALWWDDAERATGELGWFMEVVCPTVDRFETAFSSPERAEGVAHLAVCMSEPIIEHAYWGSARDRLPVAQVDPLRMSAEPAVVDTRRGKRVRVQGRSNLCLIRSGQDWSDTSEQERDLYLNEMSPTLLAGMDFLRDQGREIGCLNCRFMQVLDSNTGQALEKSFGLAYFDELSNLERWAKTHPTHVAIFSGFMRYVQTLNSQVQLRLYHEISVIPAGAQLFEYVNCHPESGLLSR